MFVVVLAVSCVSIVFRCCPDTSVDFLAFENMNGTNICFNFLKPCYIKGRAQKIYFPKLFAILISYHPLPFECGLFIGPGWACC